MTSSLPTALLPPVDERGFSLIFARKSEQWLIHLWSNQVTFCSINNAEPLTFDADRTYKFVLPPQVKLENRGFYRHDVASAKQREQAAKEYTRLVAEKLAQGFELRADSRALEQASKRKKPKPLPASKINVLKGWASLAYWGTRHLEAERPDVLAAAQIFADESEAPVKFATLKRVRPQTPALSVTVKGDVADGRFGGSFLWVMGDLHVRGNLEIGVDLLVSGSLTVDGIIRDTREWHHLLVRGNVKAEGLSVGSQLYAGGAVEAPFIAIDGRGELVAKSVKTQLLVEEGFSHSISARVRARHHADFAERPNEGIAILERALAPRIAKPYLKQFAADADDFYFHKHHIIDVLKRHRSIWAP